MSDKSARDRLVIRLLRMVVRLIGGAQKVREYDVMAARMDSMSSEELDAEMRERLVAHAQELERRQKPVKRYTAKDLTSAVEKYAASRRSGD